MGCECRHPRPSELSSSVGGKIVQLFRSHWREALSIQPFFGSLSLAAFLIHSFTRVHKETLGKSRILSQLSLVTSPIFFLLCSRMKWKTRKTRIASMKSSSFSFNFHFPFFRRTHDSYEFEIFTLSDLDITATGQQTMVEMMKKMENTKRDVERNWINFFVDKRRHDSDKKDRKRYIYHCENSSEGRYTTSGADSNWKTFLFILRTEKSSASDEKLSLFYVPATKKWREKEARTWLANILLYRRLPSTT